MIIDSMNFWNFDPFSLKTQISKQIKIVFVWLLFFFFSYLKISFEIFNEFLKVLSLNFLCKVTLLLLPNNLLKKWVINKLLIKNCSVGRERDSRSFVSYAEFMKYLVEFFVNFFLRTLPKQFYRNFRSKKKILINRIQQSVEYFEPSPAVKWCPQSLSNFNCLNSFAIFVRTIF